MNMGFGLGNMDKLTCFSCANKVQHDVIVCPTLLKRVADFFDAHPDVEVGPELLTSDATGIMSGCSNYEVEDLESSSLAATFKLVSTISAVADAEDRHKYIRDIQPGVCSKCGHRDWQVFGQVIGITTVVKKLKCRECEHEWEEVFTFREKRN